MKVNFVNHLDEEDKPFIKTIKSVFKHVHDKRQFNIIFVDNEEIQSINKEYRNIDKVTDVISFALLDNDECNFEALDELGDVFICVPRALEQSKEYGHSLEREIGFLSVHGYLHLTGYDHMNPEDEKVMFDKQDEILNKAKLYRK